MADRRQADDHLLDKETDKEADKETDKDPPVRTRVSDCHRVEPIGPQAGLMRWQRIIL
jgi:hypothetical protein